jgi:hypothetical protein
MPGTPDQELDALLDSTAQQLDDAIQGREQDNTAPSDEKEH